MLTARDLLAISFVEEMRAVKTSTLTYLYYKNSRVAQKRLQQIVDLNYLKLGKLTRNSEYIYFKKSPPQIMHSLLLSEFIGLLSRKYEITYCKREYECGNVRADALIRFMANKTEMCGFVEVQLTGKPDIQKYKKLKSTSAWVEVSDTFPQIFVVCDYPFDTLGLPVARFGTDLKFKA
jgi:hypothetical protein